MRWVNVIVGIKQRIGAILGNNIEELNGGDLTYWSIQASMLENLKRVVKSLVGDSSYGRPMKGMWLTANTDDFIGISEGFGFTKNGEILVLEKNLTDINAPAEGVYIYIYLRYNSATLPEVDGGKNTDIISGGSAEIINDDIGTVNGSSIDKDQIVETYAIATSDNDLIYLGYATKTGGSLVITNSTGRGIPPNGGSGTISQLPPFKARSAYIENIIYLTQVKHFDGTASSTIAIASKMSFAEEITINNNIVIGTGEKTISGGTCVFTNPIRFTEDVELNQLGAGKYINLPGDVDKLKVAGTSALNTFSGAVTNITVKNGIVTAAS